MTSILLQLRIGCVTTALLFSPALFTIAATLLTSQPAKAEKVKTKVERVTGSATNTITSLVFLDETYTKIAIEAEQVGELTHFGAFTGNFAYTATIYPAATVLFGHATLTNHKGEKLFLTAAIVEFGADYPYILVGALTITGGTGGYAGAMGTIAISGKDEASFTDTFQLDGVLTTVK